MHYVNLILILLNTMALTTLGYMVLQWSAAIEETVQTAISNEVRLQDDRIEKRVSRAKGHAEDTAETVADEPMQLRAGMPTRRR